MKGMTSSEERTIEFFKRKFGETLSQEEARRVNERVTTVFTYLAKWSREQNPALSSKESTGDYNAG